MSQIDSQSKQSAGNIAYFHNNKYQELFTHQPVNDKILALSISIILLRDLTPSVGQQKGYLGPVKTCSTNTFYL